MQQEPKNPTKEPRFGRPLIPYFLDDGDMTNDQYQVNTELFLPEEHETMQRELLVPK
jgi:hypothetical protein